MSKVRKYPDETVLDYCLNKKGDISSLFTILTNFKINYNDFDNLPQLVYDNVVKNTVTDYYKNNNHIVTSKLEDFEDYDAPFNYSFSLAFES